jgi:nuclear transport factor 2 (NTF2) superfamily protein
MTQTPPDAFTHLLAAWNEREPGRIREHLDKALSADILFADPANLTVGIDEFERMLRAFRAQGAGLRIERASGFNAHHNRYRYTWRAMLGDAEMGHGMDIAELDEDGLVVRIDAFFGPVADA